VVTVSSAGSLSAQETAQPLPRQNPIRVAVAEVSIGVAVTDSRGNFVKGLERHDFHVFDNGVESPLTGFAPIDEPGHVVLLLETGPATLFNKKAELHAADLFLASLPPQEFVAIVAYSRDPSLVLNFTSNKTQARAALADLNFVVGFGELNILSSLVSTVEWLAPLPGKKTIVVLSSGVDTSPELNWFLVAQKIQSSDVKIHAVSVSEDIRKPAKGKRLSQRENQKRVKRSFLEADQTLRKIVQPSGGRAYFPQGDKDFDRAFSRVAQSVGHEYLLAIAPSSPDGQLHMLDVKVRGARRKIEFRRSYVIPLP
jgi:VWFA-related protein